MQALSSAASIVLIPLAFVPTKLQFVARCGLVALGAVGCAFAFRRQLWIAFTLLVCVVYLTLETAFRNTLHGKVHDRWEVIEAKRTNERPRIIKSRAMHHGIWAGAFVFESIVSFGYGRFGGPAWLGVALTVSCVLIWVPPNFRTEFSEFDSRFVAIKHHASIVGLVSWRIISVCGASNLAFESFWCYVGFVVLMPILGAGILRERSVYFDLSIQAETFVLTMLVLTNTDAFVAPPPEALQWVVLGIGAAFVLYTAARLLREYPRRVWVKKAVVLPG